MFRDHPTVAHTIELIIFFRNNIFRRQLARRPYKQSRGHVGDKLLDTYCPSHCKAFLVLDHLYDILLICSRALYAGNVLFYSCERFAPGAFLFYDFLL